MGEKDLLEEGEEDLDEVDEGVLVDAAGSLGSPRRRRQSERKVARSTLQEVEEAEEGEGGIDTLPRTGNKAAALLFDPDDDIDDV